MMLPACAAIGWPVARVEHDFTDKVKGGIQAYYHSNKGQGSWITPYRASPGGLPLSFRTTEYEIARIGVIGDLTAEFGSNTLRLNVWYENNDFEQARRFYDMGTSQTVPLTSALTYQSNPFFTQWNNDYNARTFQFAVQDQWEVTEDFTVTAGFKGQSVKLRAEAINPVPGPLALGRIKAEDLFLPQVGLLYKLGGGNELFASFTQKPARLHGCGHHRAVCHLGRRLWCDLQPVASGEDQHLRRRLPLWRRQGERRDRRLPCQFLQPAALHPAGSGHCRQCVLAVQRRRCALAGCGNWPAIGSR